MTQQATAECPHCQTSFENLPVEFDEDGGYSLLETKLCADCGKLLCPACDQFHCDGCGDIFCASHMVSVEDGTPKPLHCCAACAAECEQMELELVSHCPECLGDDIQVTEYELAVCGQTGYLDAGEAFLCRACGAKGDAEELVKRPEAPARIAPQSEQRPDAAEVAAGA